MPPAVAAGIGAVASIGGAIIGGNAQRDAAQDAAAAQQRASDAQIRFARDTYNQNAQRLDPYNQSGQFAMGVLNGLLYGNASPTAGNVSAEDQAARDAAAEDAWARQALDALAAEVNPGIWSRVNNIADPSERLAALQPLLERVDRQVFGQFMSTNPRPTPGQGALGQWSPVSAAAANNAFDTFRNSTNYQFRMNEGLKGVQTGMGALGAFDSGATRKAMNDYAGNMASSELGNYMNLLAGQINTGMGAAGALAGVSTNTVGAVNAATQQAGSAAANAALISGNARANTIGSIAGALGGLTSSFGGIFGGGGGGGSLSGWGGNLGQGMSSDRRLKHDIKLLYRDDDGLGWYQFRYNNDPGQLQIGVMADEVEELRPEAFIADLRGDGYAGVQYDLLGTEYNPELVA